MAYFTTYTEASGGVTLNMGFSETIPKEDFSNWTKHVSVENTGDYDCYVRVKALAGSKYQDGLQYSDSDGKWTPGEDGYYYYSENYGAQVEVSNIGVSLVENDKVVSKRDYASNGTWDETTGDLLTALKEEKIVPGKQYEEAIKVTNSGSIDSYVRVILKKSWTNKEGVKDTSLSPDLIDLNLTDGNGWVVDEDASTTERTILYYTSILPAGSSTLALSDTLTIDGSIATKVKQDVTEKDGYQTITTTYAYDGYNFQIEAEADAVQTHNAQDAIKSAWGVDVDVDGNGNISLR